MIQFTFCLVISRVCPSVNLLRELPVPILTSERLPRTCQSKLSAYTESNSYFQQFPCVSLFVCVLLRARLFF